MSLDYRRLGQDFAAFVADPTCESSVAYANSKGLKVSHTQAIRGVRYHIVRYDKARYGDDVEGDQKLEMTDEIAMLRSIIIANGRIVCVALPKSTRSMDDAPNDRVSAMLEGPMVNAFYLRDDGCTTSEDVDGLGWQITTRSVIGARNSYFDDEEGRKMTFRDMFLEAMPESEFRNLDRNSCYSYVVRHPKNRDVFPATSAHLVMVARFRTEDDGWTWTYEAPAVPITTDFDVHPMGRTGVWADSDGNLVRAKQLNEEYKSLRKLRGTQPKLKFHYLSLRKQRGAVGQYLARYPEHSVVFSAYRDQIHQFTKELQANYWDCYVRHTKPLREYDGRYKQHMFNLHTAFKDNGRPQLLHEVIRYVNGLAPAQLMFGLNWEHRAHHGVAENSEQQEDDTGNTGGNMDESQ